jgi:ribokinase
MLRFCPRIDVSLMPQVSDVLVVGSFVQDFCWRTPEFPAPGETRIGSFAMSPGGKGSNQAVACARQLGAGRVSFVGAIGADALGQSARDFLASEAIDVRFEVSNQPTAAASVVVNQAGHNLICVALGANLSLSAHSLDAQQDLIRAAKVVVTQLEIAHPATLQALILARRHQVKTVLNPAPIQPETTSAAELAVLLNAADILTPNETELQDLLRRLHGIEITEADFQSDASLLQATRKLGAQTVIVTLGAAGVFVAPKRGAAFRVPAESVIALDTTGAGDAFNGGLAAAMVLWPDLDLKTQVRHANRVAALSVERVGAALAMPTRADVQARFGAP